MNLVPVKTAWSSQSDRMIKRQQFNKILSKFSISSKGRIHRKKNKQNKQTMDSVDIYMIVQSVCIITGSKGEAGWLDCTLYNY